MKLVALLVTVASLSPIFAAQLKQCTSKPYLSVDRIFGASDARPGEFPHQISLQVRYFSSHVCGGTLISDRWILTAAHCFSRSRYASNWKVILGEHSLRNKESNEREFLVSKVIIHENYNSDNQVNDIALAKLSRNVDFQGAERHLKPVCLADKNFAVRTGYQCVVTGWGRSEKGPVITDVLQKLQQPLLGWQQCARVWSAVDWPVTSKHVCVGDLRSPKGVCTGDSGGPVQCRLANGEWMQVGITSWTSSVCTATGYAAVFTYVPEYRNWIQQTINRN